MRLSDCPVRPAIDVIEGKWKPVVVNALKGGRLRFGQLQRHAPEASSKVLTDQLRELEDDQIISRKEFGRRWDASNMSLPLTGEPWCQS
jgi:DNA-binding HxlR family transcriptional regulator